MQCIRCAGLIVPELVIDGGLRRVVNRCVSCGTWSIASFSVIEPDASFPRPVARTHRCSGGNGAPRTNRRSKPICLIL